MERIRAILNVRRQGPLAGPTTFSPPGCVRSYPRDSLAQEPLPTTLLRALPMNSQASPRRHQQPAPALLLPRCREGHIFPLEREPARMLLPAWFRVVPRTLRNNREVLSSFLGCLVRLGATRYLTTTPPPRPAHDGRACGVVAIGTSTTRRCACLACCTHVAVATAHDDRRIPPLVIVCSDIRTIIGLVNNRQKVNVFALL